MRRRGWGPWAAAVGVALVAAGRPALSRRPAPPACPGGRFVLPEADPPLVVGSVATAPDVVVVDDGGSPTTVAVGSGCDAVAGKVKGTRKGTTVKAKWTACAGQQKVRLTAKIEPACDTMTGKVRAKGRKPRPFTATRSVCGDGILDPDNAETCEPGVAECDPGAACDACACVAAPSTTLPASTSTTVAGTSTSTTVTTTSTSTTGPTATTSSTTTSSTATTAPTTSSTTTTSSTITTSSTVPGTPPPDPATVAPPAPGGVVTGFAASVSFLWEGSGIQTGVAPGAIDEALVAVLRGRVVDAAGDPIPAVRVRILGHPEYGQTLTRIDGAFDLAVNGGGAVVVEYDKTDYLPVQRHLSPDPEDWATLPDVVLTALDPVVTPVTLDGATTDMQVARGSVVTDADGTRQATVLFPAGTTAELVMPDGSTQPITTLDVRATEFTVGESGLAAMPGVLPPTSAYTYAVELSVDQAIDAGAAEVRFSTPVVLHVDNFLGFPAGTLVPLGWYDRQRGTWVPAPSGLVLDVLGVTGGLADIDTDDDGDSDAADASQLSAIGVTEAERATLAGLYPTGGSVWRSPIPHFTPWDCNWPYGLPPDAKPPPEDPCLLWGNCRQPPVDDPCERTGSVLGCELQTLGERVGVTGTPFALVYQSARTPGRRVERMVDIPLSDGAPPASLAQVRFRGEIAGRVFTSVHGAGPNQVKHFEWDGLDAYGRPVQGPRVLHAVVSYVYPAVYLSTNTSFGGFGGDGDSSGAVLVADRRNTQIVAERRYEILLASNGPDARMHGGLGGWTLDAHHVLDPETGSVFLGSGGSRRGPATVARVAGAPGGVRPRDGIAVAGTSILAEEVHAGPDGDVYVLAQGQGVSARRVWRLDREGIIHLMVGCQAGTPGAPPGVTPADGVLAKGIDCFTSVEDFAVDGTGRLYVMLRVSTGRLAAWRVDLDGRLTRVAGRYDVSPTAGAIADGTPGRDAAFGSAQLSVSWGGKLYLAKSDVRQIFEIMPNGRLRHVAGHPAGCANVNADGIDARTACLGGPGSVLWDFEPDDAGSLYLISSPAHVVSRVDATGRWERFAGRVDTFNCTDAEIEGVPRRDSCFRTCGELAVSPEGTVYVSVSAICQRGTQRVYRLGDLVTRVLGGGSINAEGTWPTALDHKLLDNSSDLAGLAAPPGGGLLFASAITPTLPGIRRVAVGVTSGANEIVFPAPDGRVAWVFDAAGRHLRTRDVLTGATVLTFAYDAAGRLASVTDSTGNQTTVVRDGAGKPTALVAPGGQQTELHVDDDGWLTRLESPAGHALTFTYAAGGLLETATSPAADTTTFDWDPLGRLTGETNAIGGTVTLDHTPLADGIEVAVTAAGYTTTYRTQIAPGGDVVRTVVAPDGAQTVVTDRPDATRTRSNPDGTLATLARAPDPRFGMLLPFTKSLTVTKGARTWAATSTRTATGAGFFGAGKLVQTTVLNGATWTTDLDAALRTATLTTPTGRTRAITYDALGRVASITSGAGVAPYGAGWAANGLLESVGFGVFGGAIGYDAARRPTTVTDPGGRTWTYGWDAADRVTSVTDPAGHTAAIGWDVDDTLASFTLPGGSAHLLEWNGLGETTAWTPPGGTPPFARVYRADGTLERIVLPSGREQVFTRHPTSGDPTAVAYHEATVTITTAGPADLPGTLVRTPAPGHPGTATSIEYDWTAGLPAEIAFAGATAGTLVPTYGAGFRQTGQTFTSGLDQATWALGYDDDGRPTSIGPVTLTRGGPDRSVSAIAVGAGEIAVGVTPEGLPASRTVSVNGTPRYAFTLT